MLAALSVVGAVGSGWGVHSIWLVCPTSVSTESVGLTVFRGCYEFRYDHSPGTMPPGTSPYFYYGQVKVTPRNPIPRWDWRRFEWSTAISGPGGDWMFKAAVPSWLPSLLLLSLAAYAWRGPLRASARRRAGRCTRCNYDRRGLVDPANTACPECGLGATSGQR
jgi:hypothetical protein